MKIAYADPPYPGCCGLYDHRHESPYGCWDDPITTRQLINELEDYDGWALHTSSAALAEVLEDVVDANVEGYRVMAWVKPFAAFKANVPVAYAWEPVIVKPCRKQVVAQRMVMRDWIAEGITMQRGLTGAKPERVCLWLFEMLGLERDDDLLDLFPGSGAVTRAWERWRGQFDFAEAQCQPDRLDDLRDVLLRDLGLG